MKLKTYALLDLIGVSSAIQQGTAASLLEDFWDAAEVWTNTYNHECVTIPGQRSMASPEIHVSTFSDTALLHTRQELEIADFYRVVKVFKKAIENRACASYVVISRNEEIAQPPMPALGFHALGSDTLPLYTRIAGSGEAWVNLHAADKAVQKQKLWHGRYSIYCIGEKSLPDGVTPKDSIDCKGLSGQMRVYALE